MADQSLKNHVRLVPPFHFFVLPILLFNFGWTLARAIRMPSFASIETCVVAFALFLMAGLLRRFTLTVQDRVIRLEMRLRLQQSLPVDLRSRIPEFTVSQLVALRFAGDDELPTLAREVLDKNLQSRKAIKQLIRNWQADVLRA